MMQPKHFQLNPNDNHLMIDIETLGTQTLVVPIITVAANLFTMKDISDAFQIWHLEPHPESIIQYQTVRWWLQQSPIAQEAAFDLSEQQPVFEIPDMLNALSRMYKENNCQTVWCKSVMFDINHIEFYYRLYDITIPWTFRNHMEVRVMSAMLDDMEARGIYDRHSLHDPLEDCRCQIEMVQTAYAKLQPLQHTVN